MGTISTGIGLVSGINSGDIIDKLIQLERRPITVIQGRIDNANTTGSALADLSAKIDALKQSGTSLRKPSTFANVGVTSSDESVLTAAARPNTAEGSYSFRVAKLVQSQQLATTRGLATSDATPAGATKITLELGDARLKLDPALDDLNGGAGVRRGVVEIVDRAGKIAQIDLGGATTLDDVAAAINASRDADVSASVAGSKLVLTNTSAGGGKFRVSDLTGHAAEDLGFLGSVAGDTISGTDLAGIDGSTKLADLNEGRGVASGGGDGLRVTLRDGTNFDVNLGGAKTVEDVRTRFNAAANGKAFLDVNNARGLKVSDNTATPTNPLVPGYTPPAGTGHTVVAGLNGSKAAGDLRIGGDTTNGSLVGGKLVPEYGSVLTSSLLGGKGFAGGKINVTNSRGVTKTIDLTGAADVSEIVGRVAAGGAQVEARVNAAGTGLDLVDLSGGGGDFSVADAGGGTAAADLGWAGNYFSKRLASGKNLQRAWLDGATKLADLNGGAGVGLGKVKLTNSAGLTRTVDLSAGGTGGAGGAGGAGATVGDVLAKLNAAGAAGGFTAGLNDTGDGLVLTDTAGGTGKLAVEDVGGTAARDLRLAGEAVGGKIDGSYETTITVAATDSLETVRDKINDLNFAARAEVLNAGGDEPFRLSIVGRNAGKLGAFTFDARAANGTAALATSTMSAASDAAVYVGAPGSDAPLLVTSRTNTVADVVPGLTLDLKKAAREATTVTITRDVASIKEQIGGFVEGFNTLRTTIDENSKYDSKTGQRGVLLGEPVVQKVERQMYGLTNKTFETGNPKYQILADIGVKVAKGATLEFDQEKFDKAWADDPEAVSAFFTANGTGFGHLLQDRAGNLTDPLDGLLTKVEDTIKKQTDHFQDQIAGLETKVAAKRARLEREYAGLESSLSSLQYQQQQLGGIGSFDASGNRR